MSEIIHTMLVLLLLVAATFTVTFAVYTVFFIINRKRKQDIANLKVALANMKVAKDSAIIKAAALVSENITLRGLNRTLNAENEALEIENRDLMNGKFIVRIKGKRIKAD